MNEPVATGQVFLGKYRVERFLGQGGMGVVVAVRHVGLGQLHAMKFLLPTALGNEESHKRFMREARAAARLTSDHVARVTDVGYMENGAPYMVMEYLEGCDLKTLVSKQGRLSVDDTVMYVMQVCEAMAEAHAAGIVHRDLKPANLFLVRRRHSRPCVKVLDFGISKQTGPNEVDLTSLHTTLGSPLYMSPEQMGRSKSVDGRTDIWALGVILYELLTGTSPFEGHSMLEVASRVLQEEPTPLRELQSDVPEELELVITKCLRKRPEERFQTVQELHEALAKFGPPELRAQQSTVSMTNPEVVEKTGAAIGESTPLVFGRTGKTLVQKMLREIDWMAGVGLVVFIGLIAVVFWKSTRESRNASVPISNSAQAVIVKPNEFVASPKDIKPETSAIPLVQPAPSSIVDAGLVDVAPTTVKPKSVNVPEPFAPMKPRVNPKKRRSVN